MWAGRRKEAGGLARQEQTLSRGQCDINTSASMSTAMTRGVSRLEMHTRVVHLPHTLQGAPP